MKLQGSIIAVVTPMQTNGDIDYPAFAQLLDWQIQQGCTGIVVAGSTGEAATLSGEEKLALFAFAQQHIAGRVLLIAGTGTNCTRSTIALSKSAHKLGIQYSLLTCPYYNKPTQEGLYQHYQAIAQTLPSMQHVLYSIPGRSVIKIENETVLRLAQLPNIIGLKDSSSSIERIRLLRAACGPEFSLLSGDDDFTLDCLLNGGDGVISVTANVFPQAIQSLVTFALQGNEQEARRMNDHLAALMKQLFCQSNPIPVKALLHHMGKIQQGIRLPLTWLEAKFAPMLFEAYRLALSIPSFQKHT